MQQWIRKFCLQYGAALFYTSAKEDKNCDLLYKYLTHRIYGFPFRTPALVVEKDAVFIPSGWDNMNKIRILYENLHTCKPDDYFRDIIVQPTTRKVIHIFFSRFVYVINNRRPSIGKPNCWPKTNRTFWGDNSRSSSPAGTISRVQDWESLRSGRHL
jgi:hypothetical protein